MESAAENPSAQLVGNEDRNKDLILGASTTKAGHSQPKMMCRRKKSNSLVTRTKP
jgi:hypothetical protein